VVDEALLPGLPIAAPASDSADAEQHRARQLPPQAVAGSITAAVP
jgi:hypothetical protein